MKKLIIVVMIFVIITFFVIANKNESEVESVLSLTYQTEKRAVFISYIELEEYIKGKSESESKTNIIEILNNISQNNFNMVILHVRPFSDAIYPSQLYAYSKYVYNHEDNIPEYDILDYFIEEAHKRNLELHAWINPYRISNNTNISNIGVDNPIYKYLNTNHIKVIEGKGIFYNPSSLEIRELIIKGVEEIVTNYDVDGIHFDDYFYPDNAIDLLDYEKYVSSGGTLTLSDYRLNNTSMLIKGAYDAIKSINQEVLFGISPEGNINNNYDNNYIDTKRILSESGYVDYIMPQIYFGFLNELMPFIETVNMWNSLITVDNIDLIPALAFYKVGSEDTYAKGGKNEWIENDNIIKKQVLISRALNNYNGFSVFRYSYMFNQEYLNKNNLLSIELANLLDIIK